MQGFKRLSLIFALTSAIVAGLWGLQGNAAWVSATWPLKTITTSVLLILGASLFCWLAGAFNQAVQQNTGPGKALRRWLSVEADKRVPESTWVTLTIYLAVWVSLPIAILREWGLTDTSSELFRRLATAGFPVGEAQVVPGKIILGILLFAALFTFTRWLKHKLNRTWLSRTPMHPGTREAIATVFGYIMFVLAVLAGLSFAGFDLTNLAIMAGALGVGIGFGLQNIVNNFISGIILLFERPIRPGDFISVGETSGFVRNVSIRSTEIETLDRMSVIVPNSDVLTTHVHNWTLRDPFGRINVPVGVAYGSDTEKVRDILLEVGRNHPDVVQAGHAFVPGPNVLFREFGDSSLNFELRVFIRQIERRWMIQSDLNYAIDAAFRKEGVTIPFPQRDLWFRNPMPEQRAEE